MKYIKENYKKLILVLAFALNIIFSLFEIGNVLKKNEMGIILIIPFIFIIIDITISILGGIKVISNRYNKFRYYIYSAVISLVSIIAGSIFKFSNGGFITLMIFKMIICVGAMVYYYIVAKDLVKAEELDNKEVKHNFNEWAALISNIILNICLIVLFVTPYYTKDGEDIILIKSLLAPATDILPSIASFVFFVLWIISFINLSNVISIFAVGKNEFAKLSKNNAILVLGITFAFTGSGYIIALVYSLAIKILSVSSALVPVILIGLVSIIHSVFVARCGYFGEEEKVSNKTRFQKILILVFVALLTAITFACLLVNIASITFLNSKEEVVCTIEITGKTLLENYATMAKGFKLLAFVIMMFLLTSLGLFVESAVAFCSRSKYYKPLALVTCVLNFIFVFIIGIFGTYYKIINEIDKVTLQTIIDSYGFSAISGIINLDTKITSQSLYLLIGAAVVCVILFIVKPFTKYDLEDAGVFKIKNMGNELGQNNNETPNEDKPAKTEPKNEDNNETLNEDKPKAPQDFDACPAFSEIDSYKPYFDNNNNLIKQYSFANLTLPDLVKFVVDYARESRLHLSYSYEDIATFIAGLGTTRLQILQGMSGTGKTSLPKIFMEAILGNCEIVEVESSWKDKNELLGYYNEFSKVYTPKKFTQALYRAALNPEIVTFIVLDEMNLSRIEYYFSDFLSLMENEEDKREIKLLNVKLYNTYNNEKHSYLGLTNDHTIRIPRNVWFIGTANRDESTFEISDKVYDRAYTINFNKRAPKVKNFMHPIPQAYVSYEAFRGLVNNAICTFNFDLDEHEVIGSVEKLLQPYNISFGNRVAKQMEDFVKIYCSCFDNPTDLVDEALEKILLSKVVSKLEFKSIEDKEQLVREFEKLKLYSCSEFINKLNEDF